MVDLSQENRNTISENPLNDALDHIRSALQESEQFYKCGPTSAENAEVRKKAVSRLLSALMGHEVALDIYSSVANRNVASELATVIGRVRRGDFNYEQYRALSQLVIKKAPDVDIWHAVLDLITSLSRLTPPESITPSSDGTPVRHSSASQQGDEQTKRLLEPLLLHEFRDCTYRDVGGFFSKYFEGKEWSGRAQTIYTSLKDRHVNGRWTDFPAPPVEKAVWSWLSSIQDEYLAHAPGIYYTTSNPSELSGTEARRQLDLFIKPRTDTADTKHDWKDVRVIGEHRVSNNEWRAKFLQVGRYVRDVFSVQPTRRFVHAFTLLGTMMELWVFDRSGPYSSGSFDIHKEPEKFIRAIIGYALMSNEELGLDNSIERSRNDTFITITEDRTGRKRKILLEQQPMVVHKAIVCRGTTCFRSKDLKHVVKLSWPSDLRPPEAGYLRRARDHGVEGVAKLLGCRDITSIKELRNGLIFRNPYRFRSASCDGSASSESPFQSLESPHSSLGKRKSTDEGTKSSKRLRPNHRPSRLRAEYDAKHHSEEEEEEEEEEAANEVDVQTGPYENRLFSCQVISPAGRTIREFSSVKELLTALCDAIKAHRSLLTKAKILHRDISENNIIITNPKTADGLTGMLIDLDLAIVGGERTGARHQTGTMEFMAIDVLLGVEHTYRHDLESFFYVLLWICARRAWERQFHCSLKDQPKDSVLGEWYGNSFKQIAKAKRGSMHADGFKGILEEFAPAFDCIKSLCREVRRILFPLTEDGELDLSTPADSATLYNPIIAAFERSIVDLDKQT
jgi:hypothetical protein